MAVRFFKPTLSTFVKGQEVLAEAVNSVEGGVMNGLVTIKVLMASQTMVMLESYREQGVIDPWHKHDDHETVCHMVSGLLRVEIGEASFLAKPGDTWFHPKGVMHRTEALEASTQIEVKVPPCKTWN